MAIENRRTLSAIVNAFAGDSWEALELVVQRAGHFEGGFAKPRNEPLSIIPGLFWNPAREELSYPANLDTEDVNTGTFVSCSATRLSRASTLSFVTKEGHRMFHPTEAKPQSWRAVAVFDDGSRGLLYLGRSSVQVRGGYAEAYAELLDHEERSRVRDIALECWQGAADAGQWIAKASLRVPTSNAPARAAANTAA